MFNVIFCRGTCFFSLRHFGQFSQNFVKTRRNSFNQSIFGPCHRIYLISLIVFKNLSMIEKTAVGLHHKVVAAIYVLN